MGPRKYGGSRTRITARLSPARPRILAAVVRLLESEPTPIHEDESFESSSSEAAVPCSANEEAEVAGAIGDLQSLKLPPTPGRNLSLMGSTLAHMIEDTGYDGMFDERMISLSPARQSSKLLFLKSSIPYGRSALLIEPGHYP